MITKRNKETTTQWEWIEINMDSRYHPAECVLP